MKTTTLPKNENAKSKALSPAPPRHWLIRYATTDFDDHVRTITDLGLVTAPDMLSAEIEALRRHASEGFSEEDPYGMIDSESGQWTNFRGLRAFEISMDAAPVDAGTILWIEWIGEIEAAEAAILAKQFGRQLCVEEMKVEDPQQIRLRSVGQDWFRKEQNAPATL